jgi:hypothetical protein
MQGGAKKQVASGLASRSLNESYSIGGIYKCRPTVHEHALTAMNHLKSQNSNCH